MLRWREVKAGARWELLEAVSQRSRPAAIVTRSKRKLASGSGYRWRAGQASGRASTAANARNKAELHLLYSDITEPVVFIPKPCDMLGKLTGDVTVSWNGQELTLARGAIVKINQSTGKMEPYSP